MKKEVFVWQIVGFIFTCIFGVLLHFLFDWTGGSISVAPFSAVNESIWEHMKLLFFPMFVFALIENRYIGKDYPCFWYVKLIGIVLGVVLIPVLYYTTNGAFGEMPDWVNIVIFFVTAMVSYLVEFKMFQDGCKECRFSMAAFTMLLLIALIFIIFTFLPLQIPLFRNPVTGEYHNNFYNLAE